MPNDSIIPKYQNIYVWEVCVKKICLLATHCGQWFDIIPFLIGVLGGEDWEWRDIWHYIMIISFSVMNLYYCNISRVPTEPLKSTLWPVIRYNSFFNRSIGWWGLRVEGYLTLHNRRVGWVYCIYSFILYLYIFRVSLREDVRRVKEEWRIPGSAWAACSEGERHRGA